MSPSVGAFPVMSGAWVAVAAASGLLLLTLAMTQGALTGLDQAVLVAFAAGAGTALDDLFRAVTWLGSGYVLVPLALLLALPLARRRQWASVWLLGISYLGAALTTWGLKLLLERARPTLYPALADFIPQDGAFPSGHATQAAAFALGLWLLLRQGPPRWRVLAGAGLVALVLLVGASRLHLQVHWPSDVVAGLLVALFWAGVATTLVDPGRTSWRTP